MTEEVKLPAKADHQWKTAAVIWSVVFLLLGTLVTVMALGMQKSPAFGIAVLLVGAMVSPIGVTVLGRALPFTRKPVGLGLTVIGVFVAVLLMGNALHGGKAVQAEQGGDLLTATPEDTTSAHIRTWPAADIVAEDSVLRPAQDALNAGDVVNAVQLYFKPPITAQDRASTEGRRLRDAIQAATDQQAGNDPSADFAERVNSLYLPKLQSLSTDAPTAPEDLWNRVAAYEEFARNLEEASAAKLDPSGAEARRKLRSALIARQQADFPVLRGAYRDIAGRALFRLEVLVNVDGSRNGNITWTSPSFVSNANIEDAQNGSSINLNRLRFSRSAYRWMQGRNDGFHYDMKPPADGSVGYWDGSVFRNVE